MSKILVKLHQIILGSGYRSTDIPIFSCSDFALCMEQSFFYVVPACLTPIIYFQNRWYARPIDVLLETGKVNDFF